MTTKNKLQNIAVWEKTKKRLDTKKLCPDETYNGLINRIIDKVKKRYPETDRMTNTGIVHWALIKMLEKRGEA